MAYTPMTQEVIKYMNSSFDKENLISYQMLLVLFSKLFAEEEEFLKDPGDRMGLSHYVENFLRKNEFQTIVTIKDLNMIFNNNVAYDINDKELYKVFFVLIYEELSSNDPQISFKIKEAIFSLINQLQTAFGENSEEVTPEEEPIAMNQAVVEPVQIFNEPVQIFNEPVPQSPQAPFTPMDLPSFMPSFTEDVNEPREPVQDFVATPPQPIEKLPKNGPSLYPNLNNNTDKSDASFLVSNKRYLREFIQKKQLIPYQCATCGLSEWQNEPLYLELDSIDGTYSSKNLNNLRFLCPNCYSQIGHFD